jgi:hypothetical protein
MHSCLSRWCTVDLTDKRTPFLKSISTVQYKTFGFCPPPLRHCEGTRVRPSFVHRNFSVLSYSTEPSSISTCGPGGHTRQGTEPWSTPFVRTNYTRFQNFQFRALDVEGISRAFLVQMPCSLYHSVRSYGKLFLAQSTTPLHSFTPRRHQQRPRPPLASSTLCHPLLLLLLIARMLSNREARELEAMTDLMDEQAAAEPASYPPNVRYVSLLCAVTLIFSTLM